MSTTYRNRAHRLLQDHGPRHAQAYEAWVSMRRRCKGPRSKKDACYVGVSVCERWNSFDNFLADMGVPFEGGSLDRIKPTGNYEPDNCRWADAVTQRRNCRNLKLSEHDIPDIIWLRGQRLSQQKIADLYGVNQTLISAIVTGRIWQIGA